MPQVMQHSPQELTVLCGQLSLQEQERVIDYIKNIINHHNSRSHKNYSKYFGVLQGSQDPLEMQKAIRNEWN